MSRSAESWGQLEAAEKIKSLYSLKTPPPGGFHSHAQLQVSALTPIQTTATVGADQNFGLPVLMSPTNENWLDMNLEGGRSRKKLPKLGGSARIAP